jgi:hypothetical protein
MHSRSNSRLATVRCEFECAMSLRRREGRPFLGVVELDCLCEEAAIQEAKRDAVGHSIELRYPLHHSAAS